MPKEVGIGRFAGCSTGQTKVDKVAFGLFFVGWNHVQGTEMVARVEVVVALVYEVAYLGDRYQLCTDIVNLHKEPRR